MTKTKSTKRALLMSFLSILLCVSMLIGTTYAWFTDEVTSGNNIIKAGNLDVAMNWKDATATGAQQEYKDASEGPIFDYDLWEPGYVEAKNVEIKNVGSLAFKYQLRIEAEEEVSILANVIDVYYAEAEYKLNDRTMPELTRVGTLAQVLEAMPDNMTGALKAGEVDQVTIALKMQEEAGNEYKSLSIGSKFTVKLFATQDTVEFDSFDDQYDAGAEFPEFVRPAKNVKVTTADEFKAALAEAASENREVIVDAEGVTVDINVVGSDLPTGKKAIEIPGDVTIKNLTVIGSYRGGNTLYFQGTADQEIVFENCTFTLSGRTMGFDFLCAEGGVDSVIYNNCSFEGAVVLEFLSSQSGVATYNNCTFTKSTSGTNYVMAYGGTHLFNGCTFDYTGLTQSMMGTVKTASINATSDSDGSNTTVVILDGCTRINCGTHKYGSNSTLTVK